MPINVHGQTIGEPLEGWVRRPPPPRAPLIGRFCHLEPLNASRHADGLFAAYREAPDGRDWTYLPVERFDEIAEYRTFVATQADSVDPLHHAIVERASGQAVGTAALMRIDTANGVIEVGHIAFAPRLQRTPAGNEALFLLMRRVFDELGYRRLEWKCDSLNEPSRRAAARYGFEFEGIFRQAIVTKGRNRDTAWYALTDGDWPGVREALQNWLSPSNFSRNGAQKRSLASFRSDR